MAGLQTRVRRAADDVLVRRGAVAVADVLVGIGWLAATNLDGWRQGRLPYLDRLLPVGPDRVLQVVRELRAWAGEHTLPEHEIVPLGAGRRSSELRFSETPDPRLEQAMRVCWTRPDQTDLQQQRAVEQRRAKPELVVVSPLKDDWTCHECGEGGGLLTMENPGPTCLRCADLDHLVFLPSGDAALTRRAKKGSTLSAVVVRFSRARKRYERQGLLVEPAALEAAEQSCLADEEVRARRRDRDRERRAEDDEQFVERFALEIRRLFPGCPSDRAAAIAAWTATRSSGRVGRSAAGRALDGAAVELAVAASVRHEDTDYDILLMADVPRAEARDRIRSDVQALLDRWRSGSR